MLPLPEMARSSHLRYTLSPEDKVIIRDLIIKYESMELDYPDVMEYLGRSPHLTPEDKAFLENRVDYYRSKETLMPESNRNSGKPGTAGSQRP